MLIHINDDLDLKKIADSGQAFRIKEMDDTQRFFRFITNDSILYIKDLSDGNFDISCSEEEWEHIWFPYFDLGRNYSQIRADIPSEDTFHQKASAFGKGIRILKQDPFEMLITFIISQRKNIPAIRASVEKIAARFGTKLVTSYEEVYTFPSAIQMAGCNSENLSDCSLGYRLPYIIDAVMNVNSNSLSLEELFDYDTDTLFQSLLSVKGVGKKVANCICLFAYARLECAPVDVWIEKIINRYFDGINPYPQYGEVAGIMQQYAFYYIRDISI